MSSSQKLRSNPSLLVLSHSPQPTNLRTDPSSRLLYCMHHSDLSTSLCFHCLWLSLSITSSWQDCCNGSKLTSRYSPTFEIFDCFYKVKWLPVWLPSGNLIPSFSCEGDLIPAWYSGLTSPFRSSVSPAMAQVSKPNPSGSRTRHHLLPQGFCTGSFFILCFLHPPSIQLPF